MAILTTIFLASIAALTVLVFRRRYAVQSAMRQYHAAALRTHWPKDIFFGLDFTFKMQSNLSMMKQNHDRFGLTYKVDSLFSAPVINTIAPENLPLIHGRGETYGIQPRRLPGMEEFCGKGLLTTDGEIWARARRMFKPTFAKGNISKLEFLARETDGLFGKIPREGKTVDLQPLLFGMFLNSSLHFLLGIDLAEREDAAPCTPEEFLESFHDAIFGTGLRIMLGRFKSLAPKTSFRKSCTRAHAYIDYYIRQSLDSSSPASNSKSPDANRDEPHRGQRSLVQNLAAQTDDMEFIRSQVIQGMLAAQETIAVLISNAIFLLARHPNVYTALRTAVLIEGEGLFTFHALSNFKPLQNILNEALRIHPIFPVLGRACLQDTTLPVGGGPAQDQPIFVPKGAFIVTSYIALHQDPAVFGPDADAFRPDRWNEIKPRPWEFMPFGGGERACLGREKVLAEAAYVVGRFAQRFERVESRDDRPWKEIMRLTAKNVHGCLVGCVDG